MPRSTPRIGQAFADARGAGGRALRRRRADRLARPDPVPLGAADRGTLQLGQPAWIAERTGLPVVADLRAPRRRRRRPGRAARLAARRAAARGRAGTPAALNLGGIANLTVPPIAFDIGPANALLDAATRRFTGRPYDEDGRLAARGTVDDALLGRLLPIPTTPGPPRRPPARSTSTPRYVGYDRQRRGHARDADGAHRAHGRRRRPPLRRHRGDRLRRRHPQSDADARRSAELGTIPCTRATRSACPPRPRRRTRSPYSGSSRTATRRRRSRRPPAPATPASSAPSPRIRFPSRPAGNASRMIRKIGFTALVCACLTTATAQADTFKTVPTNGLTSTKHGLDAGAYARLDDLAKTFPRRDLKYVLEHPRQTTQSAAGSPWLGQVGPGAIVLQVVRPRQHRPVDPAGDHRQRGAPGRRHVGGHRSLLVSWYQDTAASPARVSFVNADSLDGGGSPTTAPRW